MPKPKTQPKPKTGAQRYIDALADALCVNGTLFAPGGRYDGEAGARLLARDIGQGLADSPDDEAKAVIGETYSRLLVSHTFGKRGGVPLDGPVWFEIIREARDEVHIRQRERRARRAAEAVGA